MTRRPCEIALGSRRLVFDSPALGVAACDCTSVIHNTHQLDIRRVEYPWHPLYGRDVYVQGTKVSWQRGLALRCKLDPEDTRYGFEVPAWMFERATCSTMHLSRPQVVWSSLLELKELLERHKSRPAGETQLELRHQPESGGVDDQEEGRGRSYPRGTVVSQGPTPRVALGRLAQGDTTSHGRSHRQAASGKARKRSKSSLSRTRRAGS
jgi:hypothetical protein